MMMKIEGGRLSRKGKSVGVVSRSCHEKKKVKVRH